MLPRDLNLVSSSYTVVWLTIAYTTLAPGNPTSSSDAFGSPDTAYTHIDTHI